MIKKNKIDYYQFYSISKKKGKIVKKFILIMLVFLTIKPAFSEESKAVKDKLNNDLVKISYFLGTQIGASLKHLQESVKLDREVFIKGLYDVLDGKELLLSEQELANAQRDFIKMRNIRTTEQNTDIKKLAEKNKSQGQAFLIKNKTLKGVLTTQSGLQYKILKQGKGKKPDLNDKVKVHYLGTLIDGTKFDSSYDRNQPATFPLTGVIKGWTEGLQLMPVGSKFRFFIPSHLAYGERGAGATIGPHSTLIFDVELLDIVN